MRPHALLLGLLLAASASHADPVETAEWTHTEGAPGGGRFSPLTDVTRENVSRLRVAWTYQHGDFWEGRFPLNINGGTSAESTPTSSVPTWANWPLPKPTRARLIPPPPKP